MDRGLARMGMLSNVGSYDSSNQSPNRENSEERDSLKVPSGVPRANEDREDGTFFSSAYSHQLEEACSRK